MDSEWHAVAEPSAHWKLFRNGMDFLHQPGVFRIRAQRIECRIAFQKDHPAFPVLQGTIKEFQSSRFIAGKTHTARVIDKTSQVAPVTGEVTALSDAA